MFLMENSLLLVMSQTMRYLRDPQMNQREKQLLKRELGAELVRASDFIFERLFALLP